MAYELRDGSGSLFKNKDKSQDNNYPDYKGDCRIDGQDYYLSAWIKDGKNGKFFSISIKPKINRSDEARQQLEPARSQPRHTQRPQQSAPSNFDNFDDDIPF